jgi:hypothetical protein
MIAARLSPGMISLGCLLNWHIGWFFAFENASGIDASVHLIAESAAIAHQPPGQGGRLNSYPLRNVGGGSGPSTASTAMPRLKS